MRFSYPVQPARRLRFMSLAERDIVGANDARSGGDRTNPSLSNAVMKMVDWKRLVQWQTALECA